MNEHAQNQPGFTFTGKHMLLVMIGFFGVIIAVNVTMATLAAGSWTGLVVKNSYVASQKFNAELANAKAQLVAGYQSHIGYQNGKLSFVLKDRNNQVVQVSKLNLEIGRPAFEQADREFLLELQSEVGFELAINLGPGIWAMKITTADSIVDYRRDVRLFVDGSGVGRVE
ncbi:MAG: FixH family protein [Pseudomonadota bacterium]